MKRFDGTDYVPERDYWRLMRGIQRVVIFMLSANWYTLAEISNATGVPEASVSADLRHLRKEAYGRQTIRKRHRGDERSGLYEYQLIVTNPSEIEMLLKKKIDYKSHVRLVAKKEEGRYLSLPREFVYKILGFSVPEDPRSDEYVVKKVEDFVVSLNCLDPFTIDGPGLINTRISYFFVGITEFIKQLR